MIFDTAIVMSHHKKGTWRAIESEAIVIAVEVQEPYLAKQILSPYQYRYRDLIAAAQDKLPELPPICTLSELDTIFARFSGACQHETDSPGNVLFEIGVLGYLQEKLEEHNSEHYEYGHFYFNSRKPITFSSSRRYCIHPIFSGSWGLVRPDKGMKCVYPAEIKESPWEG